MDCPFLLFFELEMDFGIRSFCGSQGETERLKALTRKIMQFALERKKRTVLLLSLSLEWMWERKKVLSNIRKTDQRIFDLCEHFGWTEVNRVFGRRWFAVTFLFSPPSFSGILQGEVAFRESSNWSPVIQNLPSCGEKSSLSPTNEKKMRQQELKKERCPSVWVSISKTLDWWQFGASSRCNVLSLVA